MPATPNPQCLKLCKWSLAPDVTHPATIFFDRTAEVADDLGMSWYYYRPYVSAADRRAKAAAHAKKLAKKGTKLVPVMIEGRTIARTFWGQAWCRHLESFSDYANRLPRGRTYVRNGSVIDLQIAPGKITARIMGSTLYHGTIKVAPLKPERWKAIKAECAGKIDSLVGLLQGRLSDAVMRVITDREKGLFPQPSEIKLECSCPDWANLCKHLAAALYGVGARLDLQPELLFVLRGLDHLELIGAAAETPALAQAANGAGALDAMQLSDVFGIEIVSADTTAAPVPPTVSPVARKLVSLAIEKAAKPAREAASTRAVKKKTVRGRKTRARGPRNSVAQSEGGSLLAAPKRDEDREERIAMESSSIATTSTKDGQAGGVISTTNSRLRSRRRASGRAAARH